MRTAEIYAFGKRAGTLTEGDDGRFVFLYPTLPLRFWKKAVCPFARAGARENRVIIL